MQFISPKPPQSVLLESCSTIGFSRTITQEYKKVKSPNGRKSYRKHQWRLVRKDFLLPLVEQNDRTLSFQDTIHDNATLCPGRDPRKYCQSQFAGPDCVHSARVRCQVMWIQDTYSQSYKASVASWNLVESS